MSRVTSASFVIAVLLASSGAGVYAIEPADEVRDELEAYRWYKDIPVPAVLVPTVLEVPVEEYSELPYFIVRNLTTGKNEPYYFSRKTSTKEIPVSISSGQSSGSQMRDGRYDTYSDFPVPRNSQGRVSIRITSGSPILSSKLSVSLSNNVALPNTVEIVANIGGKEKVVVAKKRMSGRVIDFPLTESASWEINFEYGQPLRIAELKLHQQNVERASSANLRFLAQPEHAYRLYYDPDRIVLSQVGESGNLSVAKQVRTVTASASIPNDLYTIADLDQDTIPDIKDNCVSVANLDQVDIDQNGRGDTCDDFDLDGRLNYVDNCPNLPNASQEDTDGDKMGDVCDEDESRITEKYPWIPWLGIGFAACVLVALFGLTAVSMRSRGVVADTTSSQDEPPSVPPVQS